jgi:hypothetical protein
MKTPLTDADKAARLPVALRLLAHPTYGAQGISDDERRELLAAANLIEDLWVRVSGVTA